MITQTFERPIQDWLSARGLDIKTDVSGIGRMLGFKNNPETIDNIRGLVRYEMTINFSKIGIADIDFHITGLSLEVDYTIHKDDAQGETPKFIVWDENGEWKDNYSVDLDNETLSEAGWSQQSNETIFREYGAAFIDSLQIDLDGMWLTLG